MTIDYEKLGEINYKYNPIYEENDFQTVKFEWDDIGSESKWAYMEAAREIVAAYLEQSKEAK